MSNKIENNKKTPDPLASVMLFTSFIAACSDETLTAGDLSNSDSDSRLNGASSTQIEFTSISDPDTDLLEPTAGPVLAGPEISQPPAALPFRT